MTSGLARLLTIGIGLLLIPACSSSSSSGGGFSGTLLSVSQDLTGDPTGRTTDITFSANLPTLLTPANFESSGGQVALSLAITGAVARVQWDARVTPSHQVRPLGIPGVPEQFNAVVSTDAVAPTFAISGATQTVGLGGDTFTVQFTGANVVASAAMDLSSWILTVSGNALDLTGSTFAFDAGSQSISVTLGAGANLHAGFQLSAPGVISVADVVVAGPVAGTASGDVTAPSLLSAVQNLDPGMGSEFGLVVDFTFDEAMDPVANTLASFNAGFPTLATAVAQPSPAVLRVTFNLPVVPGQGTVTLVSVVDAHGNAAPTGAQAIAAGSTVVNAFNVTPVVNTVANVGGDTVVATFVQALGTVSAVLPASWRLESPTGNPIDLSAATFAYDLLSKQLTITLTADDLLTGSSFLFGASGTPPFDVDGETFGLTTNGTVTGDTLVPSVLSVTQNRFVDPAGTTYYVDLSEDVQGAAAAVPGNFLFTGGATVMAATLLTDMNMVELVVDSLALPGLETLTVQNLVDIAGNTMMPSAGNGLVSSDGFVPAAISAVAFAEEGTNNDMLTVVFDDDLVPSDIVDPDNWVFESPALNVISTALAAVTWDAGQRTAVLTFSGGTGVNLQGGDFFSLGFLNIRDFGGNVVDPSSVLGNVTSEDNFPRLTSVSVAGSNPNQLHLRFSEPVQLFSDPLTIYTLRDAGGLDVGGGVPTITLDSDSLGARLLFAAGAVAGSHTLDVRGVIDLAGNQMFPATMFPITAEIASSPTLALGMQSYLAISGEENDSLEIIFNLAMSPWDLLNPAHYTLTNGADTADFTIASMSFDGAQTVSVVFDGNNPISFDNGAYTLTVDGLLSAQGAAMGGPSMDTALAAAGTDLTPAMAVSGRSRLDAATANSVLLELLEALDPTSAMDTSNFAISGVNPNMVTQLGFRTVRATFNGGVTAGSMIDITQTDLAGNTALVTEAIQVAETLGPAVIGVSGVARSGIGGDEIQIVFSQPVGASRLTKSNYTITSGGSSIDLSLATFGYESATNTVTLFLSTTIDLTQADTVNVMVSGVMNMAGIAISPTANVNGTVGGDASGPAITSAFINYREEAVGLLLDVMFSEDVDAAFMTDPVNYTFSGGQTADTALLIRSDTVRIGLSAPLSAGQTLQIVDIPDPAGNLSGTLLVTPIL